MNPHLKIATHPPGASAPSQVTFIGEGGGAVTVQIDLTPGGQAMRAIIAANDKTARKIADATARHTPRYSYELAPRTYECAARWSLSRSAPELVGAVEYAKTASAVAIEVVGMPQPVSLAPTPPNGRVVEKDVSDSVFQLVGVMAGGLGLAGFAYASENGGFLLRAVSAVPESAYQASSQSFAMDLGWHQDNANRPIADSADSHPSLKGPMNPKQSFVTIRPDAQTPMEVVALDDILDDVRMRAGAESLRELMSPCFCVAKPDSHGGGIDAEGVALIVRGSDGHYHGRFHVGTVWGVNAAAQRAYEAFRGAALETPHVIKIHGTPGSQLHYTNTRVLHRRRQYKPAFDGTDRYYVRIYGTSTESLINYAAFRNGRVFG